MYTVDLYRRVRRAHFVEGMSIREAARVFVRWYPKTRQLAKRESSS